MCFILVLFLQAVFILLDYFDVIAQYQIYMIIDKFSEVTSSLIMYHFVLELQPILIFLDFRVSLAN